MHTAITGRAPDRRGKPQETADAARPAVIADRYRVECRLTRGGMGELFRVIDATSGRPLALKRLQEKEAERRRSVVLFEREYYTLASLKHPRIVEVYDYGIDGVPFYTMELLDGQDLKQLAPVSYRDACRYLRDVASSLALLHARHLLHRDVGPRNVRLTADGRCKLLDFGALTSFGLPNEVVGTPAGTPPEALFGVPLDQRLDLYALGALGYWLLTRRQAYPASQFADLPLLWDRPLPPPSAYAPEVPEELDQLILALLSHNRLERPASAAEVIDRLSAIAGLEPENRDEIVQCYLAAPRLVGRDTELDRLARCLERSTAGRGSALFLCAPGGMGKTRFFDDSTLSARLTGATVIRADGEVDRGPFGLARALAEALVRQAPSDACQAAADDAALLAQLSPALNDVLSPDAAHDAAQAPGERRAQIQGALERWISRFCLQRPLVIFVDNVHAADQGSLGFLVGLAKLAPETRLLLAVSVRAGAPNATEPALLKLEESSERLQLPPLNARGVKELAAALFGHVPNVNRFGDWLHVKAAGNPLYCIELSRYAVARNIARYVDGAWVLPEEPPRDALPAGFEGVLTWSLQQLSPEARSFAEGLSVWQGALRLELCAVLAGELNESGRLFSVLDELVSRGILTSSESGFRFSQAAVRAELLRGLDPERKKRLHRALAEALLSEGEGEFRTTIDAGWHLMHAGDEARGADLLASVASAARVRAIVDNDLHEAVPALEAALGVYRAQNRSLYEQAPLLCALVSAGYYVDWRLAERYGDAAMSVFETILGLGVARKLRPWLGPRLSLAIGLIVAKVRFGSRREGTFKELIAAFLSCVTHLVGVSVICLNAPAARRYAEKLAPFRVLGKRLAPAGVYYYCRNLSLFADNRLAESRDAFLALLERLRDEKHYYRSLPAESRQLFTGGALYLLGVLESFRDTGETLRYADELDRLGSKFYAMVALRLRIAYHANRGEMLLIEPYRERLDLHAMQYGSAWQVDLWAPAAMLTAYSNVGDVVGVKLVADRLTNLTGDMAEMHLGQLAEGTHALLRADTQRAIVLLEALRDAGQLQGYPGCLSSWGTLATAYNHAGEHQKAKALCETKLAELAEPDLQFVVFTLKLELQLCLAEAALGNHGPAIERLDRLIEKYADRGPVTLARLHHTRARIASLVGDQHAFEVHLSAMASAANIAGSPSLLAQCKRLGRRALKNGDGLSPVPVVLGHTAGVSTIGPSRQHGEDTATLVDELGDNVFEARTLLASNAPPRSGSLQAR